MAESKITELPAATTPLAGTELVPIVQGSDTKKVAASAWQAPLGFTPEDSADKNVANGYCPLGADVKVPSANLPAGLPSIADWMSMTSNPFVRTVGQAAPFDTLDHALQNLTAAESLIIPSGTHTLDASTDRTALGHMIFMPGSLISTPVNRTLTINKQPIAGMHQIFTGLGKVRPGQTWQYLQPGSKWDLAYVDWWGAVGDNSTNDTAAIQRAIDEFFHGIAAGGYALHGGTLLCNPSGIYLVDPVLWGSGGGINTSAGVTQFFKFNGAKFRSRGTNIGKSFAVPYTAVDTTNDWFNIPGHPFLTGDVVQLRSANPPAITWSKTGYTTPDAGYQPTQRLMWCVVSGDHVQFRTHPNDTSVCNISSQGTGTHYLDYANPILIVAGSNGPGMVLEDPYFLGWSHYDLYSSITTSIFVYKGLAAKPTTLTFNGVSGVEQISLTACLANARYWWWDSVNNYLYFCAARFTSFPLLVDGTISIPVESCEAYFSSEGLYVGTSVMLNTKGIVRGSHLNTGVKVIGSGLCRFEDIRMGNIQTVYKQNKDYYSVNMNKIGFGYGGVIWGDAFILNNGYGGYFNLGAEILNGRAIVTDNLVDAQLRLEACESVTQATTYFGAESQGSTLIEFKDSSDILIEYLNYSGVNGTFKLREIIKQTGTTKNITVLKPKFGNGMSTSVAAGTCPAPVLAGLGAGNLSNATYTYKTAWQTADKGVSSPSSASASVTVTDKTTNGQVKLTFGPTHVSSNSLVTHINIYRIYAGSSYYHLIGQITNAQQDFIDNIADDPNWYKCHDTLDNGYAVPSAVIWRRFYSAESTCGNMNLIGGRKSTYPSEIGPALGQQAKHIWTPDCDDTTVMPVITMIPEVEAVPPGGSSDSCNPLWFGFPNPGAIPVDCPKESGGSFTDARGNVGIVRDDTKKLKYSVPLKIIWPMDSGGILNTYNTFNTSKDPTGTWFPVVSFDIATDTSQVVYGGRGTCSTAIQLYGDSVYRHAAIVGNSYATPGDSGSAFILKQWLGAGAGAIIWITNISCRWFKTKAEAIRWSKRCDYFSSLQCVQGSGDPGSLAATRVMELYFDYTGANVWMSTGATSWKKLSP